MRISPWMLAWALLAACGPKGAHGPTSLQSDSVDPSGSERAPEEQALQAGTEQQVDPSAAEASDTQTAGEAGSEMHSSEPLTSEVPNGETTSAAEGAAHADADANGASQGEPESPAPNPALVRKGRQVFTGTCMLCHDMGPRIAGLGWTVERMERQIRRGGKRMSAISTDKLSNAQLQALMAYLQTIGAVRSDGPPKVSSQ